MYSFPVAAAADDYKWSGLTKAERNTLTVLEARNQRSVCCVERSMLAGLCPFGGSGGGCMPCPFQLLAAARFLCLGLHGHLRVTWSSSVCI